MPTLPRLNLIGPGKVGLALGKHPCPECGGDLEWDATRQALRCPYCGTVAQAAPQAGEGAAPIVQHDLAGRGGHPPPRRGDQAAASLCGGPRCPAT